MRTAPFGTWKSPLTAEHVAGAARRIGDVVLDGGILYWGESRPEQSGRVTIMRLAEGAAPQEILPTPFSARTRVHEYGGGALTVADGIVYFSNFSDQRLYRLAPGSSPEAITPAGPWRYADGSIDRQRNRMHCVREGHSDGREPVNEIVAVDLATGETSILASGRDFYASPRLSPAGSTLCWLEWSHPDMPWDATGLFAAEVGLNGALEHPRLIAGGADESVYCPQWSPAGVLHFVSDRTGWWNLYRSRDGRIEPVWAKNAEFGVPLWNLGSTTYGFDGEDVICIHGHPGAWQLARIPADGSSPAILYLDATELGAIRVADQRAVMVAASPTSPPALISVALSSNTATPLCEPSPAVLDAAWVSKPQAIAFPTAAGAAHAFYYPAHNPDFQAPPGEKPPLIVIGHGGPTGSTSTAFSPSIQFWTTRGIAVLDVNYGGSTGYGRAYRQRLNGTWGVVDVEDCIAAARHVVGLGLADPARLLIRGGSAGGYTTLCALTFHDVFRAGASHYGIGDLEALAKDTHKFESRYLDRLVGPYPARRDVYVARSPIHHVDRLSCPIIFFQGLEDRVVPPAQAETMVAALRTKGLAVAYVPFEGEQHGFRHAENIRRTLEAELYFYGRVLGFTPAGELPPVAIDNLD